MKAGKPIRKRPSEAGIALLIAIFVLLLISVVAIALIVSSGTESALAGNYRSATGVYYAALAGLEEGRGRLLAKDPNSFKNTAPGFLPAPGTPLAVGSPVYVINPVGGETVAPWDLSSTYPDTEFGTEFSSSGFPVPPNPSPSTLSVWNRSPLNTLNVPGPLYKWVRINAVSEKSLNLDVGPAYDGFKDPVTPVFYDGAQLNVTSSGTQVLEITALAVLPNGSQKLLQYLAAPVPITLPNFPAAVYLVGNNVNFDGPDSTTFVIDGTDSFHNSSGLSCTPGSTVYTAIGYTNSGDGSHGNIRCCVMMTHPGNYIGAAGPPPTPPPYVNWLPMQPGFQTPVDYDNLVQTITQNADVKFSGNITGSSLPTTMTPTNPMTIVVNGNLDLTGWHDSGYGLLLVTGKLTYDPDAYWYGIVLVIGRGTVDGNHGGLGEFDGTVLVVQTRDPATGYTTLLSSLGQSKMTFDPSMGGKGVYYSTCWIKNSLPMASYKILSFHEISQ